MDDMYNTYDNCVFDYSYQTIFYDPHDLACKGFWSYGDMVQLMFRLADLDVDISSKDLTNSTVTINFYNNRFEQLSYSATMSTESIITLNISEDTSKNVFKTGIYYCSITFEKKNISQVVTDVETILYKEHCCLHVL